MITTKQYHNIRSLHRMVEKLSRELSWSIRVIVETRRRMQADITSNLHGYQKTKQHIEAYTREIIDNHILDRILNNKDKICAKLPARINFDIIVKHARVIYHAWQELARSQKHYQTLAAGPMSNSRKSKDHRRNVFAAALNKHIGLINRAHKSYMQAQKANVERLNSICNEIDRTIGHKCQEIVDDRGKFTIPITMIGLDCNIDDALLVYDADETLFLRSAALNKTEIILAKNNHDINFSRCSINRSAINHSSLNNLNINETKMDAAYGLSFSEIEARQIIVTQCQGKISFCSSGHIGMLCIRNCGNIELIIDGVDIDRLLLEDSTIESIQINKSTIKTMSINNSVFMANDALSITGSRINKCNLDHCSFESLVCNQSSMQINMNRTKCSQLQLSKSRAVVCTQNSIIECITVPESVVQLELQNSTLQSINLSQARMMLAIIGDKCHITPQDLTAAGTQWYMQNHKLLGFIHAQALQDKIFSTHDVSLEDKTIIGLREVLGATSGVPEDYNYIHNNNPELAMARSGGLWLASQGISYRDTAIEQFYNQRFLFQSCFKSAIAVAAGNKIINRCEQHADIVSDSINNLNLEHIFLLRDLVDEPQRPANNIDHNSGASISRNQYKLQLLQARCDMHVLNLSLKFIRDYEPGSLVMRKKYMAKIRALNIIEQALRSEETTQQVLRSLNIHLIVDETAHPSVWEKEKHLDLMFSLARYLICTYKKTSLMARCCHQQITSWISKLTPSPLQSTIDHEFRQLCATRTLPDAIIATCDFIKRVALNPGNYANATNHPSAQARGEINDLVEKINNDRGIKKLAHFKSKAYQIKIALNMCRKILDGYRPVFAFAGRGKKKKDLTTFLANYITAKSQDSNLAAKAAAIKHCIAYLRRRITDRRPPLLEKVVIDAQPLWLKRSRTSRGYKSTLDRVYQILADCEQQRYAWPTQQQINRNSNPLLTLRLLPHTKRAIYARSMEQLDTRVANLATRHLSDHEINAARKPHTGATISYSAVAESIADLEQQHTIDKRHLLQVVQDFKRLKETVLQNCAEEDSVEPKLVCGG